MTPQEIEQIIREYIPLIVHMSLATATLHGKPWVCEVHFTHDDDLNIYFHSSPQSRHGQEIANNAHVAGSIVTQHAKGEKTRAVYFEGLAEELEPGLYRIIVSDWYLIDGYKAEPAQKYHLPWKPERA